MVVLLPELTIKEAGACEPGELVRFRWTAAPVFVATSQTGKRLALLLFDDQGAFRPTYVEYGDGDQAVLSYGKDRLVISVDYKTSPEFGRGRHRNTLGCLLLSKDGWLMPVISRSGWGEAYYDFQTGSLTSLTENVFAAYPRWRLSLAAPDQAEPRELLSFDASPNEST